MSVIRTQLSTLSLLNVFNTVPSTLPRVQGYVNYILNPTVQVTTQNCNTTLGLVLTVADAGSYIGSLTVPSGTFTQEDFATLPPSEKVHIRTLGTCTASGGVCQECLSTYQGLSGDVGSFVQIPTGQGNRYNYVLTLVNSYWGSLFTAAPITSLPPSLPVRRQLYYPLLQKNLQTDLISSLGLQELLQTSLLGIPDPFEQFLALATVYCLGGQA